MLYSECGISVLKLLGFETFAIFFRVSASVFGEFGLGKKPRFRFRKMWYRKKVSVSVKILVSSFSAFDGKVTGRFVPEIELDHPTLKIDLD